MGRGPNKSCRCCNIPRKMSRLYAKTKPPEGGKATMKVVGWICWEKKNMQLDLPS
jgi:hypothetical protein